jgi:hypothetical protein
MEANDHGLKPWARRDPSSLKLFSSSSSSSSALGFELRASHLLGRHSYHFSHSVGPFLWWGFWDRISVCPGWLQTSISFFFFIVLLFICAYKAWVISPPCPHPLPYHPLCPLLLSPTSIPSINYFALISNFVEERV